MGVSISGIVIKKVIKDDFNNFENCFRKVYPNFRLEFEKEIVLESMLDRKRGSNYIDLYYTNSGTFMTFDENALEGTYWIVITSYSIHYTKLYEMKPFSGSYFGVILKIVLGKYIQTLDWNSKKKLY